MVSTEEMERQLLAAGWESVCPGGNPAARSWRAPIGSSKHDGAFRLTRDAWYLMTEIHGTNAESEDRERLGLIAEDRATLPIATVRAMIAAYDAGDGLSEYAGEVKP